MTHTAKRVEKLSQEKELSLLEKEEKDFNRYKMKHINRPYPLLDFNEYKSYAKFSDDDESIAAKFYRLLENKARVYDGAKIDMLQVAFEIFEHYVFYKRGAKALRTKIVELLSGLG